MFCIDLNKTTNHFFPAVHISELVGDTLRHCEGSTADSYTYLNPDVTVTVQVKLKRNIRLDYNNNIWFRYCVLISFLHFHSFIPCIFVSVFQNINTFIDKSVGTVADPVFPVGAWTR